MSGSIDRRWVVGVLAASFALLSTSWARAESPNEDLMDASSEMPHAHEEGVKSAQVRPANGLEREDEAAAPRGRAARWFVPEAAPNRLAGDIGAGFVPGSSSWLFLNAEFDHQSGFIARSTYSLDLRDPERPRENFGTLSLGYRWKGRYELGATGMIAAGPGLQRIWSGGAGVFVGFGTPEGLRLTLTVLGGVIARLDPTGTQGSAALPYELQIPILVLDRLRLFVVNRGFASFTSPELFVHRAEVHALISNRWRIFGGALIGYDGVGGVFGLGGRLGDR